MRRFALAFVMTMAMCAPLTRTNLMLKDYVGKPIDTFMAERAFAADKVTPLPGGGAIYALDPFHQERTAAPCTILQGLVLSEAVRVPRHRVSPNLVQGRTYLERGIARYDSSN